MDAVIEGVQLPADGVGKITAAFVLKGRSDAQPTLSDDNTIYIPATALVDARGVEIGGPLLNALERIASSLERIEELQFQSTEALTG